MNLIKQGLKYYFLFTLNDYEAEGRKPACRNCNKGLRHLSNVNKNWLKPGLLAF
jgi:hypothetical protein